MAQINRFRYMELTSDKKPISHIDWAYVMESSDADQRQLFVLFNPAAKQPISIQRRGSQQLIPLVFDNPIMAELYRNCVRDKYKGSDTWTAAHMTAYTPDGQKAQDIPICHMQIIAHACPFCHDALIPWHLIKMDGATEPCRAHIHDHCPEKNGETVLIVIDPPNQKPKT